MKKIEVIFSPEPVDRDEAESVPVRVVGVYDDMSAYIAASHQLRTIANRCEASRFDSVWWSFESLTEPEVREVATRAVADANMIWCAACMFRPLPEMVKAWMEEWSARTYKPDAAFIALLGCPPAGNVGQAPTRLCLCRAAQTAGMSFFEKRFHYVDTQLAEQRPRAEFFPPLEKPGVFRERYYPVDHWGINE